jgi:phage terminase large subunit-like protein
VATAAARQPVFVDIANRSLVVPEIDAEPWPSLGGQVCDFIEAHLVHGPGDVLGMPAVLTDEYRLFLWRVYEVYPRDHELAGRRRFKRACLSRRKGAAKTELLAWIAITELDPEGPVRFGGWDSAGEPVGIAVRDPYIPLVATTEEQSDELAYGAAASILQECDLGNRYDIRLDAIVPRDAPGKMASLATAPNARDGARTTFQGFDETHLFVADRLKQGHRTMLRNVPKRKAADAWSLETTTMYEPGEGSVAQQTHEYAMDVAQHRLEDPRLYYDHRQASLHHDLSRRHELEAAIVEASGDAIEFADVPAIMSVYLDPGTDRPAFRRYFLNQRVKGGSRWLHPESYERLAQPRRKPRADSGTRIVLAFDGSTSRDSTALVGCTITHRPHLWVEKAWERPRTKSEQEWRVSRLDVDSALEAAIGKYDVVEFAPDPPGWNKEIEEWEEMYGEIVVRFETNQPSRMGPAADMFEQAVRDAELTIDGSEAYMRHLGNCFKAVRRGYTVPVKSTDTSPDKIDIAVAGVVAYARAMWHLANPPEKTSWRLI